MLTGCGGLPDEYDLIAAREDDFYLLKDGSIIVEPTIVDFVIEKAYFIGLSLSSVKLECDEGASYKIKLLNQRSFFILNMSNEVYQQFNDMDSFNEALSKAEFVDGVKLDIDKFDTVWNKYSEYYNKMDFTNCNLQ